MFTKITATSPTYQKGVSDLLVIKFACLHILRPSHNESPNWRNDTSPKLAIQSTIETERTNDSAGNLPTNFETDSGEDK